MKTFPWTLLAGVVLVFLPLQTVVAQRYEIRKELTTGAAVSVSTDGQFAVSPDGNRVAIVDGDELLVRDVTLRKKFARIDAARATGICYGGDGRIYMSDWNGAIACYDPKSKKQKWKTAIERAPKGARFAIALSPDEKKLIAVGPVRVLLNAKTGKVEADYQAPGVGAWFLETPGRFAVTSAEGVEFFAFEKRFNWTPTKEVAIPKLGLGGAFKDSLLGMNKSGIYEIDPEAKGAKRLYKAKKKHTLRGVLPLADGWLVNTWKKDAVLLRLNSEFKEKQQLPRANVIWPTASSPLGHTVAFQSPSTLWVVDFTKPTGPLFGLGFGARQVRWHSSRGVEASSAGITLYWHPEATAPRISHYPVQYSSMGDPFLGNEGTATVWVDPATKQKVPLQKLLTKTATAKAGSTVLLVSDPEQKEHTLHERKSGKALRVFEYGHAAEIGPDDSVYRLVPGKLICEGADGEKRWTHATGAKSLAVSGRGDRVVVGNQLIGAEEGVEIATFDFPVARAIFSDLGESLVVETDQKPSAYHWIDVDDGAVVGTIELPDLKLRIVAIEGNGQHLVAEGKPVPELELKKKRRLEAFIGPTWRPLVLLERKRE